MRRERESTIAEDIKAALALASAVIGAGFASGSEILRFFSAYGIMSWVGCAVAAGLLTLLSACAACLAGRLGASDLRALCAGALGGTGGKVACCLQGVLIAVTAGAMLSAMGELAALALPIKPAYTVGLLGSLAVGGYLAYRGLSALSTLGLWLLPACVTLYGWLLLASPQAQAFEPPKPLPAHGWHTLPLAVAYASMNAALAGGVLCEIGQGRTRKGVARVCALCGGMLLCLLLAANAALLPQARALHGAALPTVLLARPLGSAGYWACLVALSLAVMSTLIALLRTLARMLEGVLPAHVVWPAALGLALPTALLGFARAVETVYPLLGAAGTLLFIWVLLNGFSRRKKP